MGWKGKSVRMKLSNSYGNVNSSTSTTTLSTAVEVSCQRDPERVSAPGVLVYAEDNPLKQTSKPLSRPDDHSP